MPAAVLGGDTRILNMVATIQTGDRGAPGYASLEVDWVHGASAVTSSYCTSPMKLLLPRPRGRSVWACTSSFGGGLVAGDQTRLDLRLGSGTGCYLGTQAWTKVYRNPQRLTSRHGTRATLSAGSTLVFAPDPVQAFAGSTYEQTQKFELAATASVLVLDWCTAGRVAAGERWKFDDFQSRNEVWVEGVRVFQDALVLSSADGALTSRHRLGRFNCLATLVMVGPVFQDQAVRLLERVGGEAVTRRADLVVSASPVAGGAVLRLAGIQFEQVARELHRQILCLSDLLADDPWSRKW